VLHVDGLEDVASSHVYDIEDNSPFEAIVPDASARIDQSGEHMPQEIHVEIPHDQT
jgi:hypothetical protein